MKQSQMCKASTAETFPRGGSKDLFPSLSFKSFTSWYCLVCQIFLGVFQIMVHSPCSIVLQPNPWLLVLPLLEPRVSWCPARVLLLCSHISSSTGSLCTGQVWLHHWHILGAGMDGTGAARKAPGYLKKQLSADVQLTPNLISSISS